MDERASATKPTEAGVVAAAVYHGGRKIADIEIDEAGAWTKREGYVVWIGLHEPSQELLERVGDLALGATAHILDFGERAQELVL